MPCRRFAFRLPVSFLHSLDCFVYRTDDAWFEAFGRVVVEAMATGLPVVCGHRGGYVDCVTHGHDAIVVASTAEAIESVRRLRRDPGHARLLGLNASRSAVKLQRRVEDRTLELLAPLAHGLSAYIPRVPAGTAFPTHAR